MLISKLLQSLSNRVILESKEDFMAPLQAFVEDNLPVVDKFYVEIEVPLEVIIANVFKTGYYQPGNDFCDVPEDIYQSSLAAITTAWAQFMRKNKKSRKRTMEGGNQNNSPSAPITRKESLPSWAVVTEEEKIAARRDLQKLASENSQKTVNLPPVLPPRT